MKLWKRLMCIVLCAVLLSGCGVLNTPSGTDASSTLNESTAGTDSVTQPSQGGNGETTPSGDPVLPKPSEPSKPTDPSKPTNPTDPSTPTTPVEPDPEPDDGIVDIGYEPLPCSEEELYNQLFDLNNKVEINIDMPAAELQKLQDDYDHYRSFGSKSPIYRMGNLNITITTATGSTTYRINEVGVRMKGNTSRTDFYNANDGIYKYIHLKLDFQETFDDEDYYGSSAKVWADKDARDARKDRTFATLEQLEMRWNKCYDQTYLKETYAYALYRSEGVLAPLTNLCSFDWSGVHMGVYCIVEPVDKIFIEKRLPAADQDGDLYKCGWPSDFTNPSSIGIEDEDKGQFYVYDLKNNKKTSDHSALKNLIAALNSGTLTKERLAQLVDMDYFLSYAAVSYFLGNPDDLRNNYNNFYLYFKPGDRKAIIIPYDYDRCLGVTYEWNPTGNGMTRDNPFSEDIAAKDNFGGQGQRNPLFLYSVVRGGFYVKEFADVLRRVEKNGLMKPETFETWLNRSKGLYSSDVTPSKTLRNAKDRNFQFTLNDGIGGNMSFKTYITKKMAHYQSCMTNLDQYLDYVHPVQIHYYLRGDFSNWGDNPDYGMTVENGVATITLTFKKYAKFKVYGHLQNQWWGTNDMSPDTTAEYTTTGNHDNIYLKPGTYKITFDPQTQLITITPA
jgi:spore coat protein CotH